MLPHVREPLLLLAQLCTAEDEGDANGWTFDTWVLSDEAIERLVATYTSLLSPRSDTAVEQALKDAGVNLERLLFDSDTTNDSITRSDATELAAAASLLQLNGWPIDTLHLPNVPKGSRRKSESGIDVMAAQLHPHGPADHLLDDERVHFATVKHTIQADASNMRYALLKSVDELTPVYVAQQLRVLDGVLAQRNLGIDLERLYLALEDLPHPGRVTITALGTVDTDAYDSLASRNHTLPAKTPGIHHFRIIVIAGLTSLHERCP